MFTYNKYSKLEFYHVTKNTKKGSVAKKKLTSVPCSSVEFLKNQANIDVLVECVEFEPGIDIGHDSESGNQKFIEVDFLPCQVDCDTYITDPDYED